MNKVLKASLHTLLLCLFVTSTALFAPEGEEGFDPTNEPTPEPSHEPTWEEAWIQHKEDNAPSQSKDTDKPISWDDDDGLTDDGTEPATPISDVHLSLTQTANEALLNNIESFNNASDGQPKITAGVRSLGLYQFEHSGVLPTLRQIDDAYDAKIKQLNKDNDNPRFTKSTTTGIKIRQGLDAIKEYLDNEVNTENTINTNHKDVPAPELTIKTMKTDIQTFKNAPDNASEITAALKVLGLPADGTEFPTLDNIEEADLEIQTKFSKDASFTPEIKEQLSIIRNYLEKQITLDPTIESKLDATFTSKLSSKDIVDFNTAYDLLTTTAQKKAFLDNLNTLSDNPSLDPAEIIQAAYDDALKAIKPKEQSVTSKLWNTAERFWNKHGFGKTEADYVKTVIKQALSGDKTSADLLTKQEIKKSFKPLDLKQKKEILQTLQEEAAKKGTEQAIRLKPDLTGDSTQDQLKLKLYTEKLNAMIPKFEQSVNELVNSFKPMCDDGQKIISSWDRLDHKLIINLVDFSNFTYDPAQTIAEQVEDLILKQNLTVPKDKNNDPNSGVDSVTIFRNQLTTEIESIADFQDSKTVIENLTQQKINENLYKFSENQIAKLTLNQIEQISPENIISLNREERSIIITKLVKNLPVAKSVFAKFSPTQLEILYTQLPVLKAMLNS